MRNYAELVEVLPDVFQNKVVLVVISDGYDKMDPDFLSEMCKPHLNLFDTELIDEDYFTNQDKMQGNLKDVNQLLNVFKPTELETKNIVHCFYRKVNFSQALIGHTVNGTPTNKWILDRINKNMHFPSVHVVFAIKHCNAGKIDSHLWLFRGFASYFNPEIV